MTLNDSLRMPTARSAARRFCGTGNRELTSDLDAVGSHFPELLERDDAIAVAKDARQSSTSSPRI